VIIDAPYQESMKFGTTTPFYEWNWGEEILYLGFALGPKAYFNHFGWVGISYDWDKNEFYVVSSATELTGLGIYCGEFRAVPEPTTTALLLFGAGGLLWRFRKQK